MACGRSGVLSTRLEGYSLQKDDHPKRFDYHASFLPYLSHCGHQGNDQFYQLLFIVSIILVNLWQDPEKFLPERWLEDDPFGEKEKLKELFFPFALGKRNCVGQNLAKMELKLVLATLLRAFRFELQMGAEEEVVRDYFLTLKPSQAFFKVFEILDN